jgi:hypothetical protein
VAAAPPGAISPLSVSRREIWSVSAQALPQPKAAATRALRTKKGTADRNMPRSIKESPGSVNRKSPFKTGT